jgi:hypothetical protein
VATATGTLASADCGGRKLWLLSPTGDFWIVCAGGGVLLAVLASILHGRGARPSGNHSSAEPGPRHIS